MKSKQILLPVMVSLFLVTTVFAMTTSIRGDDGTVYNIGNDYSLTAFKTHLSLWSREDVSNSAQGQGTIQIIAKTSEDKRINLNLDFKQVYSRYYDNNRRLFFVGNADGTYWKAGEGGQKIIDTVYIFINLENGLASILGYGDKYFRAYNINITQIK